MDLKSSCLHHDSSGDLVLPLDHARWQEYTDAMHERYDMSPTLRKLMEAGPSKKTWDDCWNRLVYQDSVGEVSYAAVPYLAAFIRSSRKIDWNAVALISAIELARPEGPPMPEELRGDYHEAIQSMPAILAQHPDTEWDADTTQSAASCLALARGQRDFGRIYAELGLEDGLAWLERDSD
jgi:hypothetical protein